MTDVHDECPFCLRRLEQTRENNGVASGINCPRCGKFKISVPLMGNLDEDQRIRLAGLTRESTDLHREPLLITLENRDDLLALVPQRISEKAHRLLAAVFRRTEFFGQLIELDWRNQDIPLAYARNPEEFSHFVNYLNDAGLIAREPWMSGSPVHVTLTAGGFEALEARSPTGLASDSAFVAMWFDESMSDVFGDGIKPAVEEDCGFRAVRIDLEEHNDDIIDRVLAKIRTSRFLIADFTEHRNGVYFEAGYALGLYIPVIWLCRKDEMGGAHFDTEHFNHIVWTDAAQLRQRLALRIQATIGMGNRKG